MNPESSLSPRPPSSERALLPLESLRTESFPFPRRESQGAGAYVSGRIVRHDELPSPSLLKQSIPASEEILNFVSDSRAAVSSILKGADPRTLMIVGECSVSNPEATIEFGHKLAEVARVVSGKLLLVQRVYLEKSRTSLGWTGFVNDPKLDGSNDIQLGVTRGREILVELSALKIPLAHEAIDPLLSNYFDDLYSWSCLGARSTTSQLHRQFVGAFSSPVGVKNSLDGSLQAAAMAVRVAAAESTGVLQDEKGRYLMVTRSGNKDAHLVLRGGSTPNYLPSTVAQAAELLESFGLSSGLIVDCSHGNSQKQPENQGIVLRSCLDQIAKGGSPIRGVMLESSLEGGKQEISLPGTERRYGVSVTDPCLSWDATKELIFETHNALPSR